VAPFIFSVASWPATPSSKKELIRRKAPRAVPFISRRSMADGPRLADVIQQSLIGRVIGVYEAAQEQLKIAGGGR
jgi:hypothetical protein